MTSEMVKLQQKRPATSTCGIPDGSDCLEVIDCRTATVSASAVVDALSADRVVLVRKTRQEDADQTLAEVSAAFGLYESLEAQAAFASIQGHRQNVSRFFMTVNDRKDFAFILPHSEGSRAQNIQIASFYCHENTTDGGTSLFLNTDQNSRVWPSLKELVTRIDPNGKPLSAKEKAMAHARFLADEFPGAEDRVLEWRPPGSDGTKLLWAVTPLGRNFSRILHSDVYSFWYSVSHLDLDSLRECVRLMDCYDLLRGSPSGPPIDHLHLNYDRAILSSGATYCELFKRIIVLKLEPGDLLIQNNMTWAHAASNWSPGSGVRRLVAAFA